MTEKEYIITLCIVSIIALWLLIRYLYYRKKFKESDTTLLDLLNRGKGHHLKESTIIYLKKRIHDRRIFNYIPKNKGRKR